MSTTVQERLDLHKLRGMAPLSVQLLEVRSGLPAPVWRLLSVAERPAGDPFAEVIKPVVINDKGTRAVVLTAGHYDALIGRVWELERWLGELLNDTEAH